MTVLTDRTLEPGDAVRLDLLDQLNSDDAVTLADLRFALGCYRRLLARLGVIRRDAVVAELERLADLRGFLGMPAFGVYAATQLQHRARALRHYQEGL